MSHMYYIVLSCIYVIKIGFRCNAKNQKTRPADLVFLLLQQWNPWITRVGKGQAGCHLEATNLSGLGCTRKLVWIPQNLWHLSRGKFKHIINHQIWGALCSDQPILCSHPRPPFSFLCSFLVWFTKTSAKNRIHLPSLLSCSLRLTCLAPGETETF